MTGSNRSAVASATDLPFASDTFDGVITIGTFSSLHLAEQRAAALSEICRVLKPAGLFLLRDFAVGLRPTRLWTYCRFWFAGKAFGNFVTEEALEFHHLRKRELRRLIQEASMQTRSIKSEQFTTMHQRPCRGVTLLASKAAQ
jgi:ubiquinone/menaquinone biosynthesis C-methylase UbiE